MTGDAFFHILPHMLGMHGHAHDDHHDHDHEPEARIQIQELVLYWMTHNKRVPTSLQL